MQESHYIKLLQNKNEAAITRLVNEYRDVVYRTCLAYVQQHDAAEDLTQEVFLKILQSINRFKGDAKLSTWIIRIAINISLNYLRDNKKQLNNVELNEAHMQVEPGETDSRQTRKAVRKAIYSLPDKQRKVFVLFFYLKISYKEINEITGYSLSSIESLLFRARKKLQAYLLEFYKENYY